MGFDKNPFKKKYTDADGNPIDKHGNKIDVEEYDTPMYRAYGVHKKLRLWLINLNNFLAVLLFFLLFVIPLGSVVGIVVFMIFKYASAYAFAAGLAFFICAVAVISFYIVAFRIPRKRAAFFRKLKRACKKNNYKLIFKRSFFQSLFWTNDDKLDFIVKAGEWTYYVKLFGAQNRKSDVTFSQSGELIYRKLRLKNSVTVILNLKPKIKTKKIIFPSVPEDKKAVKVILLNPVPTEIYKKKINGDTVMSGNCDEVFGYTVYTGTGFIEGMMRNIENDKRKKSTEKH